MVKYFILFLLIPISSFGQGEGKVWTELGVKGSITKNLDWGLEITNRFGNRGLETFFPQATVKYKFNKYVRASVDYRAVFKKDKYLNYGFSNRLNLNVEFKHKIDRLTAVARLRYQYSFDRLTSSTKYDAEFDQAIRFKPQVSYDINKSIFSPVASIEFFYNPNSGKYGQQFTRYRAYIGVDLDINSPHEIGFGYLFDREINVASPEMKHILVLSYAYNLGFSK